MPSTAVSGVYIALLTRNDTGGQSHITFVVRDDASHSELVVQTSDETWQAYNTYGGNSLYKCTVACARRATRRPTRPRIKVSYNRPVSTGDAGPSSLFGGAEYTMIRFLEANGYDASYISGVDTHRAARCCSTTSCSSPAATTSTGPATQRTNVEAARDAGVNLAFFSGNEMFWKTRFEPSADGTDTPNRTLVSYKDTHFTRADRIRSTWTGTWRDPRFSAPVDNTPENALTGQSFVVNSGTSAITVPYAYRQLRMWRNTAVASLTPGQSRDARARHARLRVGRGPGQRLPPAGRVSALVDHRQRCRGASPTTAARTEFSQHRDAQPRHVPRAQRRARLRRRHRAVGVGPRRLEPGGHPGRHHHAAGDGQPVRRHGRAALRPCCPGLVAASATTDSTAPTATITSAPNSVADGTQVTLSGTATDTGGGVVAGVEVSTDGGATWHPATGTASWSYAWTAHGAPSTTIKVRATDDSGNLGAPSAGVSVGVTCPCSLWATASPRLSRTAATRARSRSV